MTLVLSVPEAHSSIVNEVITLKSVSIFGVGHLGSNIVYMLSKIGVPEFNLYDFDLVENRNISGGPFLRTDVGKKKIDAIKESIENSSMEPKLVQVFNKKVGARTKITSSDVYILATDSIEVRIKIFKALENKKGHLIDLRSRSTLGIVYSFSLDDTIAKIWYVKSMEAQLKDPTEPVHCNESNIIYNSYLIGSVASRVFLEVIDGNTDLRGFKIDSNELSIIEIPMNYSQLRKDFKSQIEKLCEYCKKSHKTKAARNKCKEKQTGKASSTDKSKIASRSQFL